MVIDKTRNLLAVVVQLLVLTPLTQPVCWWQTKDRAGWGVGGGCWGRWNCNQQWWLTKPEICFVRNLENQPLPAVLLDYRMIPWYSHEWSQCSIRNHFRYYILGVLYSVETVSTKIEFRWNRVNEDRMTRHGSCQFYIELYVWLVLYCSISWSIMYWSTCLQWKSRKN